jgi:hypothetical protein
MKNSKLNILSFICFNLLFIQFTIAQKAELKHELLYEIEFTLDSIIDVGKTPLGKRVIYPVTGGVFEGPKLKGKVLPVGADWLVELESGIRKLDVNVVLETDDGAIIYVTYTGFYHTNDDGSVYFRIIPIFETSSEKYSWLNHTISVGIGRSKKGGVEYTVYAIK